VVPENIHRYYLPRGFDSIGPYKLKKCRKLTITGTSREVGGLRKSPFCGRGIGIFWNYTIIS